MNNSIIRRLKRLEERVPDRLIILIGVDGEEKECKVDELLKYPDASLIKVISGNNVIDVDSIISWIDTLAN